MEITCVLHSLLQKTSPDAGNKIVNQKTLNAPHPLKHTAEHIKREHIEEEVRKAAMHKHVCDKLIGSKIGSLEKVKAKYAGKVYAFPFHNDCRQEHQHIYGQKSFGSLGYSVHIRIIFLHGTGHRCRNGIEPANIIQKATEHTAQAHLSAYYILLKYISGQIRPQNYRYLLYLQIIMA
jgi:hypothetical protein